MVLFLLFLGVFKPALPHQCFKRLDTVCHVDCDEKWYAVVALS